MTLLSAFGNSVGLIPPQLRIRSSVGHKAFEFEHRVIIIIIFFYTKLKVIWFVTITQLLIS